MNVDELTGEDEEIYKEVVKGSHRPIGSKEQLGQSLLETFSRTADPDTIEYKKVKHKFPIIELQRALNPDTGEMEDNCPVITGYEVKEILIPIRMPSKYKELITNDIARAFLSRDDFNLYLDMGIYCETVRSFADRYVLDLSKHHNHMVNEIAMMVAGSGAVQGQRPILAKTDIARSIQEYETVKSIQEKATKREPNILDEIAKRI